MLYRKKGSMSDAKKDHISIIPYPCRTMFQVKDVIHVIGKGSHE
jgi:hypothetical protein